MEIQYHHPIPHCLLYQARAWIFSCEKSDWLYVMVCMWLFMLHGGSGFNRSLCGCCWKKEVVCLLLINMAHVSCMIVFSGCNTCQKRFFFLFLMWTCLCLDLTVCWFMKKADLKVMTQDHFVSPWSPSLTLGCVIIIALCDSHTGLLRANASWQLFLREDQWALAAAANGGLSPAPLYCR